MPKIDIAKVPVDSRTNYPEPFNRAVEGRLRRRLGNAAGLDQFGVNLTTLKPGSATALRHWHEKEDELFYVIAGRLRMRFRDRDAIVNPGEFIVVPRGVEHMPVAEVETHVMLLEPKSTLNTGNVRNERTVETLQRI